MVKVSFTGDVSCDKPLLVACKQSDGSYKFEDIFSKIKPLLSKSDFVIGNLETVFGGENKGYNVRPFGYNSPDDFLKCLAEAGFAGFSTANNHCMDEGIEGLTRTIRLLDKLELKHVGTQIDDKAECILEYKGLKIAILSYSQSLNKTCFADKTNYIERYVNLLYPYKASRPHGIKARMISLFPVRFRENLKRFIGIPTVTQVKDSIHDEMINKEYLANIKKSIVESKKNADICIVCVHCGGQFNTIPGEYSEYIINYLADCGADAVIGNHPHVIQKIVQKGSKILAFSLGGFTLSPSAEYVYRTKDVLAEYSLIINLYYDECQKKLEKATYSICKGIEDNHMKLSVVPVYDLIEELPDNLKDELLTDIQIIKSRISGKEEDKTIFEEYVLYEL